MSKHTILSYLLPYLKKRGIPFKKKGKIITVKCPLCNEEKMSANVIPNTHIIKCLKCQEKYNIIDLATILDFKEMPSEEDVIDYLIEELNIKMPTQKEKQKVTDALDYYEEKGFDLLRLVPNTKIPIKDVAWADTVEKNKEEWKKWLEEGANIGVKTGKRSGITILDCDILNKKEKQELISKSTSKKRKDELFRKRDEGIKIVLAYLEKIKGETLINYSLGGCHLIYLYEKELPKTNVTIKDIPIDVENDGGYVVIFPSVVDDIPRNLDLTNKINKMPSELKELILKEVKAPQKTLSEELIEEIKNEDFKITPEELKLVNNDLEGCCNTTFIKLGGILRKRLNPQQTGYVLHILNKHLLEDPMDDKSVNAMIRELDKYTFCDEKDLGDEIIKYLRDTELASKAEIEMAVLGERAKGEQRKRIDKTLLYLLTEDKIVKKGRQYELIQDMDWKDTMADIDKPVNFKVPYFNDYAYFNVGDMIILGGRNKTGKTTLAMNIVKRLVEQGIKPYYIYNETGGRWAKSARILGMKDGDFYRVFESDPQKIILKPNAVTVFDWVKPPDFARTDNLFNEFVDKLEKTQGFMICFVQLKENDTFFAPNQVGQFPALLTRYVYQDEKDGTHTKFILDDIREAKLKMKKFEIPCIYNWDNREVRLISEIKEENNGINSH